MLEGQETIKRIQEFNYCQSMSKEIVDASRDKSLEDLKEIGNELFLIRNRIEKLKSIA